MDSTFPPAFDRQSAESFSELDIEECVHYDNLKLVSEFFRRRLRNMHKDRLELIQVLLFGCNSLYNDSL